MYLFHFVNITYLHLHFHLLIMAVLQHIISFLLLTASYFKFNSKDISNWKTHNFKDANETLTKNNEHAELKIIIYNILAICIRTFQLSYYCFLIAV